MATVTKLDFIARIAAEANLTQSLVADILQRFINGMAQELSKNNTVIIRNFGVLEPRLMKSRIVRIPNKAGSDFLSAPAVTVKFKPGKELKDKLAPLVAQMQRDHRVE